ncbi:hypothetical protein C8C77_10631 [Halanaerobium saccharolyticum]|uniref:DUF2953 family protein n=1 Tax=Halanaerobium saccharolyticum TaxID=43595 RepID=A0A4R7Z655_9FIRM|nr:hypothetical protein [Halanaerobium saccharolyticum]RAK09329.1 hypothetical protein C7958_10731 [Halanaerobium saccharolyticum]TDW06188.1 hypothetical protein C8C77_10631 [Halanaerobium saccharolyticum]TDX60982.1 hypothetical protein C7956_10731 [Halanaerobium saccharolyticum]
MLQFLFLFLIFVIFFIILLLVFPYHYAFNFEYKKHLKLSFSCSLLFVQLIFSADSERRSLFLKVLNFKKELNLEDNNLAKFIENKSKKVIKEKITNKIAKNKKRKQEESRTQSKSNFNFDFRLINKKNLKHIFKFIVKLLKILKMDYLKLDIIFSFADPYYNGIFLAYYYTLKELFDYPDFKVRINWQEVMFEAEGSTGGKIIPLQIIVHFLKFIFSIRSLKIFWQVYKSNSKKG